MVQVSGRVEFELRYLPYPVSAVSNLDQLFTFVRVYLFMFVRDVRCNSRYEILQLRYL